MRASAAEYSVSVEVEALAGSITGAHPKISGFVRRSTIRPEQLSYRILDPRAAGPMDRPLLGEAYECWSSVWADHLRERDGVDSVPSDNFTRQHEIGALFHDWECIGMTAFRWVDLSNPMFRDDSYFQVWPQHVVDAACSRGSRVCIGSNLTVSFPWRNANGVSVKGMLLALAIERLLCSDADALVGTMRNDRGLDQAAYRLGFKTLYQGAELHGGPVDLVGFDRETSRRQPLAGEAELILARLSSEMRRR